MNTMIADAALQWSNPGAKYDAGYREQHNQPENPAGAQYWLPAQDRGSNARDNDPDHSGNGENTVTLGDPVEYVGDAPQVSR
ncbi:MAG TPA: hypothetical protein VK830_01055, partial [Xanthomonadales bacterium]|nr:hypothetical protein [Xanthomonadales bacterium]